MANLDRLTTTFVPPASCTSFAGYYQIRTDSELEDGSTATSIYELLGPLVDEHPECYPNNFNPTRGNYYSPGLCPSGYTPGCSPTEFKSSTVQTCCPTEFPFTCIATAEALHPHQNFLQCGYGIEGRFTWDPLTVIRDGTTTTTISTQQGGGINAYGIEVRMVDSTSTQETASGPTSATTTSTESPPSPSETGGGGSGSGDSGLSTGAVAGIAVGAALGGLLIGSLLIWFFLRRWFAKRRLETAQPDQSQGQGTPGMGGWYTPAKSPFSHADTQSPPPGGYYQPVASEMSTSPTAQRPGGMGTMAPHGMYAEGGYQGSGPASEIDGNPVGGRDR